MTNNNITKLIINIRTCAATPTIQPLWLRRALIRNATRDGRNRMLLWCKASAH